MRDAAVKSVQVLINGHPVTVPNGITVTAALALAGVTAIRRSRTGDPRGALCGMGICHECCAEIDGVAHQRTCQTQCSDGLRIRLDD